MAPKELAPRLKVFRVPDSNLRGMGLRLRVDPDPVLGTLGALSDAPWCPPGAGAEQTRDRSCSGGVWRPSEPGTREAQGGDAEAARPQREGASPTDDCAARQAGLLLGGGACAQAAAQRQLLHAELKLVLQKKGEREQEPGAQVTPSSAMEVRSRSAEVSAHTSSKGRLWGLGGGHRLGQQGNTSRRLCASVSLSMKWK
ncbi:PREDICTED: uncharacterized protein LOC102239508 [Myotis brandtii]|uniref:uncharacterized protein LOC102239508 n=1 Tax=Myotis brandtii TaxID=109478 RepID=UPI000703F5F5|nr:PREDICTED: uncharacterized protein LOC102239508 [Myotis brandtii]